MSDETTTGTEPASKFEPIASQEDLDRILKERLARERKKYEGFDELKAKADKYDELEQSTKTEAQKQQEALQKAQRELTELTVAKTRAEVAAAKGVPASLLAGSTAEEIEAAADALIAFRGEQAPAAPRSAAIGRVNTTETKGSPAERFAAQMDGKL